MKTIKICLNIWRIIPLVIIVKILMKSEKESILLDFEMNNTEKNESFSLLKYSLLVLNNKPYRSIFYERARLAGLSSTVRICRFLIPTLNSIEFVVDETMGPGIRIAHNSLVVHAKKLGSRIVFGPFVVVGKNNNGRPILLDNVIINSNSTVFGDIILADVVVGAGSVVNKSFSNTTIVGVPARKLEHLKQN